MVAKWTDFTQIFGIWWEASDSKLPLDTLLYAFDYAGSRLIESVVVTAKVSLEK